MRTIHSLIKPFLIFSILSVVSLLSGCDNKNSTDDVGLTNAEYIIKARKQLEEITITDGINKTEATVIFEIYGFRFFNNNGWGEIENGSSNWEGNVLDHWSDKPLKHKVLINKETGATSWKGGPTIENYKELLDACPSYNFKTKC